MKFKVGDIVIGRNFVNRPELNGLEGEVARVGPFLGRHRVYQTEIRLVDYFVHWSDGHQGGADEKNLRRKYPPIPPHVLRTFEARPVGEPA